MIVRADSAASGWSTQRSQLRSRSISRAMPTFVAAFVVFVIVSGSLVAASRNFDQGAAPGFNDTPTSPTNLMLKEGPFPITQVDVPN
jgi:hypothetical protein